MLLIPLAKELLNDFYGENLEFIDEYGVEWIAKSMFSKNEFYKNDYPEIVAMPQKIMDALKNCTYWGGSKNVYAEPMHDYVYACHRKNIKAERKNPELSAYHGEENLFW